MRTRREPYLELRRMDLSFPPQPGRGLSCRVIVSVGCVQYGTGKYPDELEARTGNILNLYRKSMFALFTFMFHCVSILLLFECLIDKI